MKSVDKNLLIILILILIIFIIIFNIDRFKSNKLNSRENFLINIYDDTKDKNGESLSDLIAPCNKESGTKEDIIYKFTKCRLGKKEDYFSCINGIQVDTSCL